MWRIIDIEKQNWKDLEHTFQWIKDMDGVPQDPIFHQEGDVAVHTQMVVAVLQKLPEYNALDEQSQAILYAAALLHDVEKRSTTVIEADGRITSARHAKRGEYTARSVLYKLKNHPCFEYKEAIAKLVRYHGLPLWIFERPRPKKMLFQVSLEVNTHWLYILAKADVLGRICDTQADLLYRLELFQELCKEHDCYGQAKAFGSDWGRYAYFVKEDNAVDYVPFEGNAFEVVMLSALPGTGKDTFVKKRYKDWAMVSIDDLRRKHKVSPTDKKKNGQMVQLAKEAARVHLRKRQSFVWNATNITRSMRKQLIDLFQSYGAKTTVVYLEVPYTQLLTQNKNRQYQIPDKVIQRMIDKLEVPCLWEAPKVEYHTY